MIQDTVIIGYSGHAYVLLECLLSRHIQVKGYCEKALKSHNPYNLEYLGTEQDEAVLSLIAAMNVYIGIGNNRVRKDIYEFLKSHQIQMPPVMHAQAFVSGSVAVADACSVMPHAVINAQASLGTGVICNTGCVVEHECKIGDFGHIAPGAVLAGNVKIGSNSFVGANATIKEGVTVGNNVVIGAGSVVIRDVPDNSKVVGNPQRIIH